MGQMKKISFVIPCYRSEHTLPHVIAEIDGKMKTMEQYCYDIFLVNDCSPDGTFDVIRRLCKEHENIRGIDFARNFGQHSALMAGLRHSDGDYVVCLDDDGQTPADQVDRLIGKLEEGYDAVYARYDHKQHSAFRNLGSKLNERMTRMMLGKPPELYISSYFAAKRFVVDDMVRYENSYPYIIGLVLRATRNIANVSGILGKALTDCHRNGGHKRGDGLSLRPVHHSQEVHQSSGASGVQLPDVGCCHLRGHDYADAGPDRGIYRADLYQPEQFAPVCHPGKAESGCRRAEG